MRCFSESREFSFSIYIYIYIYIFLVVTDLIKSNVTSHNIREESELELTSISIITVFFFFCIFFLFMVINLITDSKTVEE